MLVLISLEIPLVRSSGHIGTSNVMTIQSYVAETMFC